MKKQFLFTGFAAMLSLGVMAQKNTDAVKFGQSITKERAYSHLSILASDEYEGRETGKKGAWMAAEYIKKQFQGFGLKGPVKDGSDPYFQKVGLVTNDVSAASLSINGKAKQVLKDFLISANSVPTDGLKIDANEVVFAGYGITKEGYDDFAGINAEGKVIMIFSAGDPTVKAGEADPNPRAAMMARSRMMTNLMKAKPKAILMVNMGFDQMPEYMKAAQTSGRIMLKKDGPAAPAPQRPVLTTITISPSTANEILKSSNTTVEALAAKIAADVKPASLTVTVPFSASAEKKETAQRGENVLGFLEGSDPKLKSEVLVITGHYDHIGLVQDPNAKDKVNNGADDDGSGTTGVLLLAEAFSKAKKAGKGPKRSILFMTVVGEEKGLFGSEWYSEHPIFPVENTIADLNTDMIGRIGEDYLGKPDSANYIYSVGSFKLSTELGKISEDIAKTYFDKMILDYKFDDPKDPQQIYFRSDHYNFAKLGIPVIFYYDGMLEQDYHQPGDEVSKINFPLLTKRAHLTYYTAWELANRATRPVVDKKPDGATRNRN